LSAQLLDGSKTASDIREEIAERVRIHFERTGVQPGLAAVMIGDDPASRTYVGMKGRACKKAGMLSRAYELPALTSQAEAEALIDELNADDRVHGILVQHPVPKHLDELAILSRVATRKDVDGIGRGSLGALLTGEKAFVAATPLGIMELLDRYEIPVAGKEAVVVGRSIILGKPVAMLLLNRHATVTICHSRTQDLARHTSRADILVAAVGKPELIRGEAIKPGAVVIDAGYNKVEGRAGDVGDVHFDSAAEVASWITPVPGGVGPMTIAMLLRNTLDAAEAAA
jgi:methylenetetrahydrofolate dehydrogenase (NADP+)/methenyltetrahydrofolate cyclohydrolase